MTATTPFPKYTTHWLSHDLIPDTLDAAFLKNCQEILHSTKFDTGQLSVEYSVLRPSNYFHQNNK